MKKRNTTLEKDMNDIALSIIQMLDSGHTLKQVVVNMQNEIITILLKRHDGNQFRIARVMGVDRKTVGRFIKRIPKADNDEDA